MGQYYKPVLIDEQGNISTLYSHQYDNGLKLMEHSYIGNNFVNAVSTQLWKHPMRLAWVGDYSDSMDGDPYESKLPHEQFMKYYNAAWCEDDDQWHIHPAPRNIVTMKSRRFIVNHSQQCYIDLRKYIDANHWTETGSYDHGVFDPFATYDMCIHPLPLLTACGNGRGGGDYYDSHPDYDKVGIWAFDLIELTDKRPQGYAPVELHFTEQQLAA